MAMNTLNLPAIDRAADATNINAMNMENSRKTSQRVDRKFAEDERVENTKWLLSVAQNGMNMLEQNPEQARSYLRMMDEDGKRRGTWENLSIDYENMSDEQLFAAAKEGFENMGQRAGIGLSGLQGEKTTYSQPVPGVNEAGEQNLYRPDSTGGMTDTGVGAPAKSPLVEVRNGPQEAGMTQEQKLMAGHRVGNYTKITDASMAAEGTINTIDQMRLFDFEGGPGTDFKNAARRMVMAMGGSEYVDVSAVNDAASFTGLAYREFLNIMSTQKGPQTDNDFLRIKQTFATVTDPVETRDFLMSSAYALASRKIEMAKFWDEYMTENQGSLQGVERAWDNYKKTTPMVTDAFTDPNTGMPVFYVDYKDRMQIANPGVSEEIIIREWRKKTSAGGK